MPEMRTAPGSTTRLKILPDAFGSPPTHCNTFVRVAAEQDYVYYPKVMVGQQVKEGDIIAEFTDLFGEKIGDLRFPATGPVLFLVTSPAINKSDPLMAIGA